MTNQDTESGAQCDLAQLKEQLKNKLDNIALKKFSQKIAQFRQLRQSFLKEISAAKEYEPVCTIPVIESLQETMTNLIAKINAFSLMRTNPNLQCHQLVRIPVLIKGCQEIPTNHLVRDLVDKIIPHLIELNDDLVSLCFAIALYYPRMCEGEYLGVELLQEVSDRLNSLQSNVEARLTKLLNYHSYRCEALKEIISYNHIEDCRYKLIRLDHMYCFELKRAVNFIYKTYVLVHDLVQKDYAKLEAFKLATDQTGTFDCKELDSIYL